MRRLIFILSLTGLLMHTSYAQQLTANISTWDIGSEQTAYFLSGTVTEAARTIGQSQTDILLLQNVPGREFCEQLIEALLPEEYSLAVYSDFSRVTENGPVQLAVLARTEALNAGVQPWRTSSFKSQSSGFVFATLEKDGSILTVYSAYFEKSKSTAEGSALDVQLSMAVREASSEELLRHIEQSAVSSETVIVGGNFNTDSGVPVFISEATLSNFRNAGFASVFATLSETESLVNLYRAKFPKAEFQNLWQRDASFRGPPKLFHSSSLSRSLLSSEVQLPVVVPPLVAVMEPEPEQAEPEIQDSPLVEAEVAVTELLAQPGSILTGEETQAAETAFSNGLFSVAWWKVRPYAVFWAAAGFLIFIAVAAGLMNSGKSHNRARKEILPARFLQNGDSSAVITCPACDVTLMVPAKALAAHEGVPHRLASGVNPMPYFDVCCSHGNDHSWMSRAIFAERNAVRAEDIVKQGLIPDVARWMKDSFLKKLLFQRAALQKTQEMSTEQVAKLEERLSKINENFRSKLDHYEGRISELERDNNVKDELNRKLMRAKILSAEAAKKAQYAKPSPAEDEKDTKSWQFPSDYPPST